MQPFEESEMCIFSVMGNLIQMITSRWRFSACESRRQVGKGFSWAILNLLWGLPPPSMSPCLSVSVSLSLPPSIWFWTFQRLILSVCVLWTSSCSLKESHKKVFYSSRAALMGLSLCTMHWTFPGRRPCASEQPDEPVGSAQTDRDSWGRTLALMDAEWPLHTC